MVKININSGQYVNNFYSDNCKITLYDMYLSEQRKEIGMSQRKLVGYQFHLLKIHICIDDVMCTRAR